MINCFANCNATETISVPAGTYLVYAKYYTASYTLICEKKATVTVDGGNDPCANAGGDSDGDGTCDHDDCQPNDPNFPATPGTTCNDGNPNTANDVVTADGCGCAGTPTGPEICIHRDASNSKTSCGSGNNYGFYAKNLVSGISEDDRYKISNGEFKEFDDGTATFTARATNRSNSSVKFDISVNLSGRTSTPPAGSPKGTNCYNINTGDWYYYTNLSGTLTGLNDVAGGVISIALDNNIAFQVGTGANLNDENRFGASSWLSYTVVSDPSASGVHFKDHVQMDFNIRLSGSGGDPCPTGGGACANQGGDADGDGVCAYQDCNDNDANVPAIPGTSCNDGDANTDNDVIQSDGCTCAGTNNGGGGSGCGNISISAGPGSIIVSGLDGAPVSSVQVFSTDWTQVFYTCFGSCDATETIPLSAGSYIVLAKYYNASWVPECDITETVTVANALVASDYFDFEVVKQEEHAEILWVHNQGGIVDDYVVEHSLDGSSFAELVDHPSKGGTEAEVYHAYDFQPATGDNFYRIRMDLSDGNVTYSDMRLVHYADLIDFTLFPNPANQFAKVNLETVVGKEDVTISIFNNLGVTVKTFELAEVYSKYFQMDIRELKEGHYIVWLNVPGHKPLARQLVVGKL